MIILAQIKEISNGEGKAKIINILLQT